jgi:hypothetical protein
MTEIRGESGRARWPRVLQSLVEVPTYRSKRRVTVHMVAAYGAECEDCGWRGPLRSTEDIAVQDRHAHITVHNDGPTDG